MTASFYGKFPNPMTLCRVYYTSGRDFLSLGFLVVIRIMRFISQPRLGTKPGRLMKVTSIGLAARPSPYLDKAGEKRPHRGLWTVREGVLSQWA